MVKHCAFQGCHKNHAAKGYCATHYARILRTGDVNLVRPPGRDPIHVKEKRCGRCHKIRPVDDFFPINVVGKRGVKQGLQSYCKLCRNIYKKEWSLAIRLEVIQAYGNRCSCCGQDQVEFLTIDHITGGGREHRKQVAPSGSSGSFYIWLKKQGYPKSQFGCLCMNCNWAKGIHGICPHKIKPRY